MRFLRKYFLTGILILTPVLVTGYILWKVFSSIDNLLGPLQKRYPIIDIPGLGFIIIIVLIVLTGFFAGNLIGRRIIHVGERLLNYIPLVPRIYNAVKELSQVFLADRKTAFQEVVLVRYPHPGSFALAFVTREGSEYFNSLVGSEVVNVFVPTTPNPTSGFLLLVPKKDVLKVSITVEEGMKMVISGGAFSPPILEGLARRAG
ncbi:MAG: DUF502 domain-containing protein [Candidatus Latescibacteria bacterium]|nr:DUF502 domain-containing protein [Candidatus Latescibacterota bacterium]NIM21609.1 DUF502 domain-containing protein [Candidatus Latescibacterota bacterium]NIM64588.1 DUF502 domain-containing protein [Candidatus Latescibacterota bacterium]NIO01103.1 DUF502 domain-containing protein [Candidatus Latescibacterota bacterium]NIO27496.1 DUF502 domain-containing protein [Candidatus Latescibacterota bacterium]